MRKGKYRPTRNSEALRNSYSFGSVVDDFNAFVRFMGGALNSYKSSFFDMIKVNGYTDYNSFLDSVYPNKHQINQEESLIKSKVSKVLARFFTSSTDVNTDGKIYSSNGNVIRNFISNMKTVKGNGTAYGTVTGLNLSGSSFKYREWLYRTANTATENILLDTTDGSGLNGYRIGFANLAGSYELFIRIADADAVEINLAYPVLTLSTLYLVEIDWELGNDPIVKYNGVVQSISTTTTNNTVTEFTANSTCKINSLYNNTLPLNNCEVNHLSIGDANGFNHSWAMLETNGLASPDIIGNSHVYWSASPNWTTPSTLGINWLNQVGYNQGFYLDGTNDWVLTSGVLSTITAATEEIRLTAYFRISSTTGSPVIISFDDGVDGQLNLGVSSSTGAFFLFCPDVYTTTKNGSTVVSLNELHKAELVIDVTNETMSTYLDDVIEHNAIAIEQSTMLSMLAGLTRLTLGQELDTSSPSNFLGGVLSLTSIIVDGTQIISSAGYTKQSGALDWYVPASSQSLDALGGLLLNKSAKYYAQLKSPVFKGNGSTTKLSVTGITQTFNDTVPVVVEFRGTATATGTVEIYVDSRTTSFYDGVVIYKDSTDEIKIGIRRNASDVRIVTFTPVKTTSCVRRFEILLTGTKYYEDNVEIIADDNALTGSALTAFSNSNTWVLGQSWSLTDLSVTTQEMSDFKMKHGTASAWERYLPLQEGAGNNAYCIITGTTYTGANIVWTNVAECSHYNTLKGFYFDGTRNVPASYSDPTVDVLGNNIEAPWVTNKMVDTFAEVDFNPESLLELSNLPNNWQIGDVATSPLFVDQSGSDEFNFTLYTFTPSGTELTNIQNYHNI